MKISKENVKNAIKRCVPIYIMCFFIGAIVLVMGMLNYWNNLSDVQYMEVERTASDICKSMIMFESLSNTDTKNDTDENVLLEAEQMLNYNNILDIENTSVYVYNMDTGEFTGSDAATTETFEKRIDPPENKKGIKDGYVYTCFEYNDNLLVYVVMDITATVSLFKNVCLEISLLFLGALILVFYPLIFVVSLLVKNEKIKKGLLYAVTTFVALMLSLILTLFSGIVLFSNMSETQSRILTSTGTSVDLISSLDDNTIEQVTVSLEGYGLECDEEYKDASAKEKCLNIILKYDGGYFKDMFVRTPNDNIWDVDEPIENRVTIEVVPNYIVSGLMDYIIQCVMLTLLSLVLVMETLNYEKVKTKREKSNNIKEFLDSMRISRRFTYNTRMRLILTLKSVADALTVAVAMKLMKSYVYSANPDNGSTIVNIIVIIASAISCFGLLLAPQIYKRCKNSITVFRVAAVICIIGSLGCFFLSKNIGYVIGYLVVAVGDLIMGLVTQFYTMESDDEAEKWSIRSDISKGIKAGSLIGYVIAAVLMSLLPYQFMYMISAVALGLLLLMTIGFPMDVQTGSVPETSNIKAILKMKHIIPYVILVLIPFGFSAYFFKYKMPLDIADLGFTATVVSFIYFFQNFMNLIFKRTVFGKKFLKRFKSKTLIVAYMALTAGLYVAYFFLSDFIWIVVIAMLLALVNARLGGKFFSCLNELTGNDDNNEFGNSMIFKFGRSCGKTIAPAVTQFFGLIGLPFLLVICAGIFVFKSRDKKPKVKAQT